MLFLRIFIGPRIWHIFCIFIYMRFVFEEKLRACPNYP